jgi:hypothetical protein
MSDAPTVLDREGIEIALKRYDIVLRYLSYAHTIYWSRSQFFLVANAGLFGFVALKVPYSMRDFSYAQAMILAVYCVGGITLSLLWRTALIATAGWIARWEAICVSLEGEAFGPTEVLRNCRRERKPSAKRIARHTASLFITLWGLAIIYLSGIILMRFACSVK